MTVIQIENKLPKHILEKAVKSGNEFGWRQSDFIEVVETVRQMELAIIGGQIQYILTDGTYELYWLSYDPITRQKNENWKDYCNRTAKECSEKFQTMISHIDIENEAINNFESIKTKKENGINLSEFLTFILSFEDNKNDNAEANEFISYDELQNVVDNNITDNYKTCAEFLLSAVTDYPKFNLLEPKELIYELRKEIKGNLTFDNLDNFLKSLNSNVSGWKMETISSLLEMFDFERKCDFNRNIEMETIIKKLTEHFRHEINNE
jgi:hypothetical protein